ncbi:MAG: hypothetical protein ACOX4L_12160 [Bacillota bacterium]|jgi:O-antigen/teichoic acid export membrane protein
MRTKNVVVNTIFSIALEVLLLVIGMILPRLIILTYGSEINGLTSTINQILSVVNLLQAGAVGASIYALYKPVAEKNYDLISDVLYSSKKYFNRLGFIFITIIIVLAPMLAFVKATESISKVEIIISVLILGIGSAYSFFFVSWYDILFSAHQRRYILSTASIIEKLVYFVLLFVVVKLNLYFIYMYLIVLVGNTVKVTILYCLYKKEYATKLKPKQQCQNYKIKNRGYLLCNQIAIQAIESVPIILIYLIYGLKYVSVYSIYNLVQNGLKMAINTIQYSISASFGNVVTMESNEKISEVFNILQYLFVVFGVFLSICSALLFMPFITIYTNGITDQNYIFPLLPILIIVHIIIFSIYIPYALLSNVYGLFRETYFGFVILALISIGISAILTFYSMPMVLSCMICYYSASTLYLLWVLRKNIVWFSLNKLRRRSCLLLLLPSLSYLIGQTEIINITTWYTWVIAGCLCSFVSLVAVLLWSFLFEREELYISLSYAKGLFSKLVI